MALVRCPIHQIPYNDANPRGCPACAVEKEGGDEAALIRELARASRTLRAPTMAEPELGPAEPDDATGTAGELAAAPGFLTRAFWALQEHRNFVLGSIVSVALVVALVATSGPRLIEDPIPAPFPGTPLPLPIEVNVPIDAVFARLGAQPPRTNPDSPQLARHSYGEDLTVDVLNGIVYAITFSVTNRIWHGIRVGMPRLHVEGALTLLGNPEEVGPAFAPDAQLRGGYQVHSSLAMLPRRTLKAEVRPPNGCYDVLVDLQPQVRGYLEEGDSRWPVVAEQDQLPEWVATRVRIVSRSLSDRYADGIAC